MELHKLSSTQERQALAKWLGELHEFVNMMDRHIEQLQVGQDALAHELRTYRAEVTAKLTGKQWTIEGLKLIPIALGAIATLKPELRTLLEPIINFTRGLTP